METQGIQSRSGEGRGRQTTVVAPAPHHCTARLPAAARAATRAGRARQAKPPPLAAARRWGAAQPRGWWGGMGIRGGWVTNGVSWWCAGLELGRKIPQARRQRRKKRGGGECAPRDGVYLQYSCVERGQERALRARVRGLRFHGARQYALSSAPAVLPRSYLPPPSFPQRAPIYGPPLSLGGVAEVAMVTEGLGLPPPTAHSGCSSSNVG